MRWLNSFIRKLVGGLDNQHELTRKARVASMYGSVIGPRPNRNTHSDINDDERPANSNAGLHDADLNCSARHAAMERERRRRRGKLHHSPAKDRKASDRGRR